MPQDQQLPGAAPAAPTLWRNPEFRALVYQVLVVLAVVATGYIIFQNTLTNLEQRGISTGFAFLRNEAGFGISETMPIPRLEAGFLHFILSVLFGIAMVYGLSRWAAARGRNIGDDLPLLLGAILFIVVIPVSVLYINGNNILTDTYDPSKTYGLALKTGLVNTVKVSLLGCVLATILGTILGIARLSSNWLIAKLATLYVEIIRNIPPLLQIFFWYFAVLRTLPNVRNSIEFWGFAVLNNRGVYLPSPQPQGPAPMLGLAFVAGLIGAYLWARHSRLHQEATGRRLPVFWPGLGIVVLPMLLVWLLLGEPFALTYPELRGFNYRGGMVVTPEFAAMLVALVMYTAAFIAETVRSGILAVSRGQREAAMALGLRPGQVLWLVVLPQALRVIIPPMTSQYLNLTKNSSLGVAIAFPELVSVGGTILNQSGQAIEVIGLTMAVYLTFSLLISLFMNWYNAKIRLVER